MTHKLYKNNKIEEKKYNTKSYLSYFPCYYHEIHLHCKIMYNYTSSAFLFA